MIPILALDNPGDRQRIETLLQQLALDPASLALGRGERAKQMAGVIKILADVAERGDAAIVENARQFDDPDFSINQLRVTPQEMADAHGRAPKNQLTAIQRSIAQVQEYQAHLMPAAVTPLKRPGVELGMRYTPLESAGLYFPGGKAAYPSTLIMLAVPAQVAGVKKIVVCSPPSKYGKIDLVLAACHELKLTEVFRAGGAAAIGAMAFGTATIPRVDKIVGPGNVYVQFAKRALAGCVGIDGFLGPSEILTIADESGIPAFIAADLLAQAEHDPGSCYLLTDSRKLANAVVGEIEKQLPRLSRRAAAQKALTERSAIVVGSSMEELIALGNKFAAEHVNLQTSDNEAMLKKLTNAGAVFVGPYAAVAAGDYVAGPSHCLPTNTTARFSSGISVFEFLKRSSIEKYDENGFAADADAIIAMAEAEHLDGHAKSVEIRRREVE
jgi:histidinol dehydrogenase